MKIAKNAFKPNRNSSRLFIVFLLIIVLTACQKSIEPKSDVQNPKSQLLNTLIRPSDIPGNWEWTLFEINQPSQIKWIDKNGLIDSAMVMIAGTLSDTAGKRYYISGYETVEQYDIPATSTKPIEINSVFGADAKTSFIPEINLSTAKYKCFESSFFIDCEVIIEHQKSLSIISIVMPIDFGKQASINLLETIVQTANNKLQTLPAQ